MPRISSISWQHLSQEAVIASQRLGEHRAPDVQALLTLSERPLHQLLESLNESVIGEATRQLVELSGNEVTLLPYQGLVELLNQRRLANPRIACHSMQADRP